MYAESDESRNSWYNPNMSNQTDNIEAVARELCLKGLVEGGL